jgi:regulator of sirC expression with transglutaminase-like and TPR domain
MRVAREIYPELNAQHEAKIQREFESGLAKLRENLRDSADARKRLELINAFLFSDLKLQTFHDGQTGEEHPDQYFPHAVLKRRKGVCLGLTSVYLWLSEALPLPLDPCHAPGHIYIQHQDDGQCFSVETTDRGRLFERLDAQREAKIENPMIDPKTYFSPVGKLGVLSDWLNAAAWCSAVGTAKRPLSKERTILAAKLSVELNPNNFNNWDTLAEAYRFANKPESALEALQKAAALFPNLEKYQKESYWQERLKEFEQLAQAAKLNPSKATGTGLKSEKTSISETQVDP